MISKHIGKAADSSTKKWDSAFPNAARCLFQC